MIYYFIGGSDRTTDVERNSLKKGEELQQRVDTCSFNLLGGARPTQNQEVVLFDGITITSYSGTALVIDKGFTTFSKFRAGEKIWLGLGETTEESVTISSVSDNGKNITLTAAAVNAHSAGEKMGKKIFGGTILSINDKNLHLLQNLIISISAASYTKIFDKKLINDSWKNRSCKYMIVDFINSTVNYNEEIDAFEYANNTAIQAAWAESGDGGNPTTDAADFQEGSYSGVFPWTNSGGSATFTRAITSVDVSDLTGIASGTPTKGIIAFWYKQSDNTDVTDIRVRIGSDSSNYQEVTLSPTANNTWNYARLDLVDGSKTGTPVWTATDYVAVIINETGSSNVKIDGLRLNATNSFTFDNVSAGTTFDSFVSSYKKPTEVIQRLADQSLFYWYIDYNRDIHFFQQETNLSPFSLTQTSNNFYDLSISTDAAKIINRQIVQGASETSSTKTQQDVPGDGQRKEWVLRNKFKNLVVMINTDSTNTYSFATSSVLPDFVNTETSSAYFSNYNGQSVRGAATTPTPSTLSIMRFRYHEIIPIVTLAKENASINSLKTILGNDGLFDGRKIVDKSLQSRAEAEARAQVEIDKYSNPIINASFTTNYEGLRAGQIIRITDATTGRAVDQDFVIQRIFTTNVSPDDGVNLYSVKCASTVFGVMELLQKLLQQQTDLEVDEDEQLFQLETINEEITATESWTSSDQNVTRETVSTTESWTTLELEPPFYWQTTTQSAKFTWSFAQWST